MALSIPVFANNLEFGRVFDSARTRGDYIILDNGANEGSQAQPEGLFSYARILRANEIVLPDVLGDRDKTIQAIDAFLAKHTTVNSMYKFMAVLQGTTMRQIIWSARYLSEKPMIKVLGVPRLLAAALGQSCRIDIANHIERSMPGRFQIHLLGANPLWPGEVRAAAKYAGHIRSMDTSMPFNYYLQGSEMNLTSRTKVARRPDYFSQYFTDKNPNLLIHNIQTMMEWANATAPVSSV
jgi:hypothetical protein